MENVRDSNEGTREKKNDEERINQLNYERFVGTRHRSISEPFKT
jgi:hypothetical protein